MTAQVVSGQLAAAELRQTLAAKVREIQAKSPAFQPTLTIVQVGGREDSNVYIRMKVKAGEEVGVRVNHLQLPKYGTFSCWFC